MFCFSCVAFAQKATLKGSIVDESTHQALSFANIFIKEIEKGATSDENGDFEISNIPTGKYHIRVTHLGCEPQIIFINIEKDTSIHIHLHHHSELLDEVVIHGHHSGNSATENSSSLNQGFIKEQANLDLSLLLENILGVSALKTGSSLSKPIIHGNFGNRVTILNNGIPQSGQQWGNDHAPEIDPITADHISVVSGVSSVQYFGNTLGGLVLIEPKNINKEPHLHGFVNYIYESNGKGHTANLNIEKGDSLFSWRLTGTYKQNGDKSTPNYLLKNTGGNEKNISLQVDRNITKNWFSKLYYSRFDAEIGILRGSHIGNTTDLELALNRDIPFFTDNNFSYNIESPRQRVIHHLLKVENNIILNDKKAFKITYANQINKREEFDVRRQNQSDRAALSLIQSNHFFDAQYHFESENYFSKIGTQYRFTDNENQAGTGVLPLIPDYRTYEGAVYAQNQFSFNTLDLDFGLRYHYIRSDVQKISNDLPRRIIDFRHINHNFAVLSGLSTTWNEIESKFNLGFATRNPAINELHSFGLHQGISALEEGNADLKVEKNFNSSIALNRTFNEKFHIKTLVKYQYFNNYIFLEPQDELRLTIRGSFPVFLYKQANAGIFSVDASAYLQITENLTTNLQYAYLRGRNLSNSTDLVYMSPNHIKASIKYSFKTKSINHNLSLEQSWTGEQKNIKGIFDFAPPPDSYFLTDLKWQTDINIFKRNLHCFFAVKNVFDTEYRNYLNRQRYFADETGRSFNIGLRFDY